MTKTLRGNRSLTYNLQVFLINARGNSGTHEIRAAVATAGRSTCFVMIIASIIEPKYP